MTVYIKTQELKSTVFSKVHFGLKKTTANSEQKVKIMVQRKQSLQSVYNVGVV